MSPCGQRLRNLRTGARNGSNATNETHAGQAEAMQLVKPMLGLWLEPVTPIPQEGPSQAPQRQPRDARNKIKLHLANFKTTVWSPWMEAWWWGAEPFRYSSKGHHNQGGDGRVIHDSVARITFLLLGLLSSCREAHVLVIQAKPSGKVAPRLPALVDPIAATTCGACNI